MKEYREKQIQEISYLWKKLASASTSRKVPTNNILNLIEKNNNEKYYGFFVRKIIIPAKLMQGV